MTALSSVLLVGRRRDAELNAVAPVLRSFGVPVARLDIDDLDSVAVTFAPPHALNVAGADLVPTVVWARDLSPRAMVGDPELVDGTFADQTWWAVSRRPAKGDPHQLESLFVGDSRAAFLAQLADLAPAFFPGREPGKLRQLVDAKELGIRTPDTVVATDPDQAPSSWASVVIKALDQHYIEYPAGSLSWYWPRVWDRTSRLPWPRPGLPAVLQEYVEHSGEVRTFFVDGEVSTFEIKKSVPTDVWLAPDQVRVTPIATPPAVRIAVTALARRWGLRYGAFDFLLRDSEPVFLETNADGSWRWFERRAGVTPVTALAIRALTHLHRAVAPAPDRTEVRLDLLTLLTGRAGRDGRGASQRRE